MLQPKSARLPVALATGLLGKRPLAHLLVYAIHRRLSGTFEFVDDTRERANIVVADGMVSRVSTSTPVIYLGHMLYELGVIDAVQLSGSLAAVATTKRLHGQILLASGMIDREHLADALRQQRSRKLLHCFTLSENAAFSFYPDVDLVGARADDVEPTNPLPLIWRGVRAYPPWDHVRATIATVAGHPLRVVGSLERSGLEDKERATAERLRQTPLTVSEIVIRGRLDVRAADLLAYFLVITKLAEITDSVVPMVPGTIAATTPARPVAPPPTATVVAKPATPPTSVPAADAMAEKPTRVSDATMPASSLPSGEYVRRISFAMRAATGDANPLRIPSPMPGSLPRSLTPHTLAAHPKASPPELAEAEQSLSDAEMRFVLGERELAVRLVRKALTAAPGMPDALAFLAYLEAMGAPPTAQLHDLLRMIDTALLAEESCRRGRFYRAEIKKRLGDHEGAIRDLRAAVRDDPNDVDARRELGAYERKVRDGTIILRSMSPSTGTPRATGLVDWLRGRKGD